MSAGSTAQKAVVKITADDQTARGVAAATERMKRLSAAAGQVNAALMMIGKGLDAPLRAAVANFANFDHALRSAAALAKATNNEMQKMAAVAGSIGAGGIFSAADALAGMNTLSRMGFDASAVTSSISAFADLAQVIGSDIPAAADLGGRMVKTFGNSAGSAAEIADALAYTLNNTALRGEEIRAVFGRLAPSIQKANISFKDALSVMGALASSGLGAEKAGEAANKIFTAIANGQMKLADLDGVTAWQERLSKSTGTASAAVAKMNAGVKGAINDMGGAFDTLSRTFGDALAPTVEQLARAAEASARFAAVVVGEFPRATAAVTAAIAGFVGLSTAAQAVKALGAVLPAVTSALAANTAAMESNAAAAAKMGRGQKVLAGLTAFGTGYALGDYATNALADWGAGINPAKDAVTLAEKRVAEASENTSVARTSGNARAIADAVKEEANAYAELSKRLNELSSAHSRRRTSILDSDEAAEAKRQRATAPIDAAAAEAAAKARSLMQGSPSAGGSSPALLAQLADDSAKAKQQQLALEEKLAEVSRSRLDNEIAQIDKEYNAYDLLIKQQLKFARAKGDKTGAAALELKADSIKWQREQRVADVRKQHEQSRAADIAALVGDTGARSRNLDRAALDYRINQTAESDINAAITLTERALASISAEVTAAGEKTAEAMERLQSAATDSGYAAARADYTAAAGVLSDRQGRADALAVRLRDLTARRDADFLSASADYAGRLSGQDSSLAARASSARLNQLFSAAESAGDISAMQSMLAPVQSFAAEVKKAYSNQLKAAQADKMITAEERATLDRLSSAYSTVSDQAEDYSSRIAAVQNSAPRMGGAGSFDAVSALNKAMLQTDGGDKQLAKLTDIAEIAKEQKRYLQQLADNGGLTF